MGSMEYKGFRDLKVYQLAFKLSNEIFELTKSFPNEEKYSLTDQIRRSFRSAAINIREGFAKRRYENIFIRHLIDSLGSSEETRGWLDFSFEAKYIYKEKHDYFDNQYDKLNAMLFKLIENWKNYK